MGSRILMLAAAVVLASLSACNSGAIRLYDGNPRPASELAVITMPEQLEVARVNGVEVKNASGMLQSGDKTLEVLPGRYELLVFYREIWSQPDQHEVMRSNPALFVVNAEAGHRYRVDYAPAKTFDQAKALTASFHGWVRDEASGTKVESSDSHLQFRDGPMSQLSGNLDLVPVVAGDGKSGAQQQAVAPLPITPAPAAASATAVPVAPAAPAAAAAAAGQDWLVLMQGWWKQAGSEDRRAFLRWVSEQP